MYAERSPEPGLGLVCDWTQTSVEAYAQLVVPDGCVDLIWTGDAVLVAGPDARARVAALPAGARFAGVRFRPGAAPHLLGVPAQALLDRTADLTELWGAGAQRVADEAAGDPLPALHGRLRDAGPPDPATAATMAALVRCATVREAAGRLGLSERGLHRRSLTLFGYGPKILQRVLRFQRALRLARGGTGLADVAYAAGYADQPHLAHEVRLLTGMTLGELR
jgi:AraC-like DNA-binding protein